MAKQGLAGRVSRNGGGGKATRLVQSGMPRGYAGRGDFAGNQRAHDARRTAQHDDTNVTRYDDAVSLDDFLNEVSTKEPKRDAGAANNGNGNAPMSYMETTRQSNPHKQRRSSKRTGGSRRSGDVSDIASSSPSAYAPIDEIPVNRSDLTIAKHRRAEKRKKSVDAGNIKKMDLSIVTDTISNIRGRTFAGNVTALGNWFYRNKIVFIPVTFISIAIGMFLNRYVSCVLSIVMVACGMIAIRADGDNDMFMVYLLALLVFAFPFLF